MAKASGVGTQDGVANPVAEQAVGAEGVGQSGPSECEAEFLGKDSEKAKKIDKQNCQAKSAHKKISRSERFIRRPPVPQVIKLLGL